MSALDSCSWSAIVRGAAIYNVPSEASVVSNIAPKHYGVAAINYPIDPVQDAGEKQLFSNMKGQWGVRRIIWYIEQGDDLMRARPIEFDFFREFDENPSHDDLQVTSVLLECESAKAPLHPRDELLKTNCTLKTDLSVVPKEHFEKKSRCDSSGKMINWWELHYKLVVTIQSGPMLFSMKCRGKQYGAVPSKY